MLLAAKTVLILEHTSTLNFVRSTINFEYIFGRIRRMVKAGIGPRITFTKIESLPWFEHTPDDTNV